MPRPKDSIAELVYELEVREAARTVEQLLAVPSSPPSKASAKMYAALEEAVTDRIQTLACACCDPQAKQAAAYYLNYLVGDLARMAGSFRDHLDAAGIDVTIHPLPRELRS